MGGGQERVGQGIEGGGLEVGVGSCFCGSIVKVGWESHYDRNSLVVNKILLFLT